MIAGTLSPAFRAVNWREIDPIHRHGRGILRNCMLHELAESRLNVALVRSEDAIHRLRAQNDTC
jgi:hypothetical protein